MTKNSCAALRLSPLLLLATTPLGLSQTGPITLNGAPSIHYSPKPPCTLSRGSIALTQNTSTNAIFISGLRLIEDDPFPATAVQVRFRSPRFHAGPFRCSPGDRYDCQVKFTPPLDLNKQAGRPFLFDISVGRAEMVLEFTQGPPCVFQLSPESTMVPNVEATVPVNGPSRTQTAIPGELRLRFAPAGCAESIEAQWRPFDRSIPVRFPLTVELATGNRNCRYRRPPSQTEASTLRLDQSNANPDSHDHTPKPTRLTGLSFPTPPQPDGKPSKPFVAVKGPQ